MWLMLQSEKPDDFVIATCKTHTVNDFVKQAFSYLDLDWQDHVVVDEKLFRPSEVFELRGDYQKAKRDLGWEPEIGFEQLVKMMVDADLARLQDLNQGVRVVNDLMPVDDVLLRSIPR